MRNEHEFQQRFKKEGYVLIKNFFSTEEIATLIADIRETSDKKTEADILDVGNLQFHALLMHKSEKLRQFISQPKVVDFLKIFMGPDIWVRWDQAVEKRPGAGTFPWHTDNSYSGITDPHFQFWISLTKMTKENGGIWLKPGSHKKKFKHINDGHHTVAEDDGSEEIFIDAEIGDIVLFSSKLLHSTTPNTTQESRWAYVIEYMKVGHVDPFIEPPYLKIAKNGQPALRYVDQLSGEKLLLNKLKYFRAHQKGDTYRAKQKAKLESL
jgi:ectoine hydroxylase-related dioxygenase (phytanoyl-CoA dioxygenase family)